MFRRRCDACSAASNAAAAAFSEGSSTTTAAAAEAPLRGGPSPPGTVTLLLSTEDEPRWRAGPCASLRGCERREREACRVDRLLRDGSQVFTTSILPYLLGGVCRCFQGVGREGGGVRANLTLP
eukprot:Rhum_TRINITY_DN11110_c0_g1::Rhum_TRINITY_DN11110_c0_g1_i1::g.42523::m.42523